MPWQQDALRFAPKLLECVILSHFIVEKMHDDGPIIEQNPPALAISLDAHPLIAQFLFQAMIDLFANRMQLSPAITGDNHKIVEYRGDLAHVEHDNVLAPVIVSCAGRSQRELEASLRDLFGCSRWFGDIESHVRKGNI